MKGDQEKLEVEKNSFVNALGICSIEKGFVGCWGLGGLCVFVVLGFLFCGVGFFLLFCVWVLFVYTIS